jgi:hypothetical protein
MDIEGRFEADRAEYRLGDPITVTLELVNPGHVDVYVFVPRGRADGLRIGVRQSTGYRLADMTAEPEPGLVAEVALPPSRSHRQVFPLSAWLFFTAPGTYDVECSLPVRIASASLRQAGAHRMEESRTIASVLRLTIRPEA